MTRLNRATTEAAGDIEMGLRSGAGVAEPVATAARPVPAPDALARDLWSLGIVPRLLQGRDGQPFLQPRIDAAGVSRSRGASTPPAVDNFALKSAVEAYQKPQTGGPHFFDFECPILQDITFDPWCAEDGNSFDGEQIKQWLPATGTRNSPLTNAPISLAGLVPNVQVRKLVLYGALVRGETWPALPPVPQAPSAPVRGQGAGAPTLVAELRQNFWRTLKEVGGGLTVSGVLAGLGYGIARIPTQGLPVACGSFEACAIDQHGGLTPAEQTFFNDVTGQTMGWIASTLISPQVQNLTAQCRDLIFKCEDDRLDAMLASQANAVQAKHNAFTIAVAVLGSGAVATAAYGAFLVARQRQRWLRAVDQHHAQAVAGTAAQQAQYERDLTAYLPLGAERREVRAALDADLDALARAQAHADLAGKAKAGPAEDTDATKENVGAGGEGAKSPAGPSNSVPGPEDETGSTHAEADQGAAAGLWAAAHSAVASVGGLWAAASSVAASGNGAPTAGTTTARTSGPAKAFYASINATRLSAEALRRIQRDLRDLQKNQAVYAAQGVAAEPDDDDLREWTARLTPPAESELGRGLQQAGLGHLDLRVRFPQDYPNHPPLVLLAGPKFSHRYNYSGALCIDLLHPLHWKATYRLGTVLVQILAFLSDPQHLQAVSSGVAQVKAGRYGLRSAESFFHSSIVQPDMWSFNG